MSNEKQGCTSDLLGVRIGESVIHRMTSPRDREKVNNLKMGAVLISSIPDDGLPELIDHYKVALARGGSLEHSPGEYSILSAGPLLDSIDNVAFRDVYAQNGSIFVELVYTLARKQGVNLRRNYQWRPLVQVTVGLDARTHCVRVSWLGVMTLQGGEPLAVEIIEKTVSIEVIGVQQK